MNKREECLRKACEIVNGQREQSYGTPEDNFKVIANFWSDYLEVDVSPVDVSMMMGLLKIARIRSGSFTEDSFIDLAGYAACGFEIAIGHDVSGKDCYGCFGASFGDCATCDIPDVNCHEQCKEKLTVDKEMAIRILDRDSAREAIAELEYYAGFDGDKVVDAIEEAMQMGADALREQTSKHEE